VRKNPNLYRGAMRRPNFVVRVRQPVEVIAWLLFVAVLRNRALQTGVIRLGSVPCGASGQAPVPWVLAVSGFSGGRVQIHID
jgi:hypothetical protein